MLHLRKLRHDLVSGALPKGSFQKILLGMLYINFSPLWDPVIELLVSHAKEMDNKDFWKVFYEHLDKVAISTGTGLLTEKELLDELEDVQTLVLDQDHDKVQSGDADVLYLEQLQFRFLLWKARSRELSPLLLMFIKQLIAHLNIFSIFQPTVTLPGTKAEGVVHSAMNMKLDDSLLLK
ncbi:UNVERIFIED_CONTAM: hypothetical protein FKN15_046132 [Acipenser sinensis]